MQFSDPVNLDSSHPATNDIDVNIRANREWQNVFDALTVPVSILNRDMIILRANMAFARVISMDIRDVIGKKSHELLHDIKPLLISSQYKVIEEKRSVRAEAKIGDRFFSITVSPAMNEEGMASVFILLMDDISAIKLAEERMNEEAKVTTAMLDVAMAVSSLTSIGELMNKVSIVCRTVFNSSSCMNYLFNKETESFVPAASSGLPPYAVPIFSASKLSKDDMLLVKGLIMDKRIFTVTNVDLSPFVNKVLFKSMGSSSFMVAPFVHMGEVLGIIFVSYDQYRDFSDRETAILRGISRQVSVSIANTRMYQTIMNKSMELSHQIETIQAMHEIDMSILSAIDRDVILETAVNMVGRVVPCDRGVVLAANVEKGSFVFVAGSGIPFSKGADIPFAETSATEVIITRRPQYYPDIARADDLLAMEEKISNDGIRALIRVPLIVKEDVVGVLGVGSKRASAYTPDDLSTLESLAGLIAVGLEHSRLIEDLTTSNVEIEQTRNATVMALAKLAEFRDPETGYHLERLSHYSKILAEECIKDSVEADSVKEKFVQDIAKASILHDIGKVGVKDVILLKTGGMTKEEFEEMKKHAAMGGEIIEAAEKMVTFKSFLTMAKEIAYGHHEKYNGSGYPNGLKGEAIPLAARIVALTDFYDALTSHRGYRDWVKSHDEVKIMILEEDGKHFDPGVIKAFLRREADFIRINQQFPDK